MRSKRIISGLLAALMLFGLAGCGEEQPLGTTKNETTEGTTAETTVETTVETTTETTEETVDVCVETTPIVPLAFLSDVDVRFKKQEDGFVKVYAKSELDDSTGKVIVVDMDSAKQTIDGFGASFTDTATYLFDSLSEETRKEVLTKLFDDEKGIGLDLLRNPIGACDFSLEYYTYNDLPEGETDYELEHFDFSKAAGQVALTKQAMEINPDIKLFLAPWSAPLWMKTKYEWNTATAMTKLRRDCYNVYADYLVKCIQGYEDQGVPVYAFSVQNEPLIVTNWPSMHWEWEQLADFTVDRMVPALEEAGLTTKILNLDHNWQRLEEGGWELMAATMGSANGMAFHWYNGDPEIMVEVAEKFPNIDMYVTEASYNRPADLGCMMEVCSKAVRSLRSGAQGYIMWNMAIGPNGGPTYNDVNLQNSGLVTIDDQAGTATFTGDFYSMAHFSKFIHQGAVALSSTDTGADSGYKLTNIVTRNPNGTMTAVLVNRMREDVVCKLVVGDQVMEVNMAARSIVTLTWGGN